MMNHIKVFNKYRFLLYNLISRDFKLKYRRSILGALWSVLNPLFMMMVITAVFAQVFKTQVDNFPVYYIVGSSLFNFMLEATNGCLSAITGNASLIKKVYIPKYIFILEKSLFALVNFALSLIAVFIVMVILRFNIVPTFYLMLVPIFCTLVFSTGLGLILATSNVFFRDTTHLYGIVTTAWMFLTPIVYPEEILPQNILNFCQLNPMYHFVKYFRDVLMYGNVPGLGTNLLCLGISFGFLFVGIIVFKKSQDKFILYI